MDVKRRTLLKGMAATAAVGVASSHVSFASSIESALITVRQSVAGVLVKKPIEAVIEQGFLNTAFAAGLETTSIDRTTVVKGIDFAQISRLVRQRSHNLIGVIDHGNAAYLVQLARMNNAKIHWLGQHSLSAKGNSHNILRSGNSESCQTQLAKDFASCSSTHQLREQGINHETIVGTGSSPHPQAWAAALLSALSQLHVNNAEFKQPPLISQVPVHQGSAVTFFIETC